MTAKNRIVLHRFPVLYHFFIRLLYGKNFKSRYAAISGLIPEGSSVTEVCCGDCYLYEKYLKPKNIRYLGLDISSSFIDSAHRKKINAKAFDITVDIVPESEYIIMQGSLFQFIPNQKVVLSKLFEAATKQVIISESIKNWSEINNRLVLSLAKKLSAWTDPTTERFDEIRLSKAFGLYRDQLVGQFKIKGGRELVNVFNVRRP